MAWGPADNHRAAGSAGGGEAGLHRQRCPLSTHQDSLSARRDTGINTKVSPGSRVCAGSAPNTMRRLDLPGTLSRGRVLEVQGQGGAWDAGQEAAGQDRSRTDGTTGGEGRSPPGGSATTAKTTGRWGLKQQTLTVSAFWRPKVLDQGSSRSLSSWNGNSLLTWPFLVLHVGKGTEHQDRDREKERERQKGRERGGRERWRERDGEREGKRDREREREGPSSHPQSPLNTCAL